jgi:hypothetical protein
MPDITIFSTPKPFVDPHIATIQRNAVRSWLGLGDRVEVLLVGDEPGMAEAAAELGVRHLTEVGTNAWGTPLISDIFALARRRGAGELLCYVNADILLTPDLPEAAKLVYGQRQDFLLVGQRWDLDVREELDFGPGWVERLRKSVAAQGRLHAPAGSDYFVFPRHLFQEIPDFAVGRAGWDNWMIQHARERGWPVVDSSRAITIVHQDHDYSHLPDARGHYLHEESDLNRALAGGKANMFTLIDADYRLEDGNITPIGPSLPRLIRRVELALTPHAVHPRGLRWALAQRLRRWRRSIQ